jgi:ATP-dependent RNA circularization protein (DNA/RNA ligase family)
MSEKYPRTFHVPWSPGATSDDKRLVSVDHLLNVPLVITEKMDGSNLCMTKHTVYARSHNGPPTHLSFDYAKSIHSSVRHSIPDGVSVFGEYLFAVHSILYETLPGYFLIFGVREDATGKWWSWEMVQEMAAELGMPTVPYCATKIFRSEIDLIEVSERLAELPSKYGDFREGHVFRVAGEFTDFSKSVAKWVRVNHVTSSTHWMHQEIKRNKLV